MTESNQTTMDTPQKLKNFPVAFFAMVMGSFGLTLSWQKAAEVLSLPSLIAEVLLLVSASVFAIISVVYLLKIMLYREAVRKEFFHPIKLSFFPAFSIGLILSSIATLHQSAALSEYLWLLGSLLQLTLTLSVLTRWIHHPDFKIGHSTPAWFIPVVGNILVPIAGVQHGYYELSWFFFSIGLTFWIVLKTLIFNRLMFHEPLPEKLLPTLFILVAPPAVGFISYLQLNAGELDNFARLLFYTAAFTVLLLATQAERFTKIQFFMSWWAYSFPLAAFTIATLLMYQHTATNAFLWLGYLMLVVVTLVISLLFYKTVRAIISGAVFHTD